MAMIDPAMILEAAGARNIPVHLRCTSGWVLNGKLVLLQRHKNGQGWELWRPVADTLDAAETVQAALDYLGARDEHGQPVRVLPDRPAGVPVPNSEG